MQKTKQGRSEYERDSRTEDLLRAVEDRDFREKRYQEYGLAVGDGK